jgi:hypothetical protein
MCLINIPRQFFMSIFRKHWSLHPYLFAIYIVIAPLNHNIYEITLEYIRSLVITFIGAVLVILVVRLLIKNTLKANLISSGFILISFLYKQLILLLPKLAAPKWLSAENYLLPIYFLFFSCWVYWILKKSNNNEDISRYFNWVGLILLVFPIYGLRQYSAILEKSRTGLQTTTAQFLEQTDIEDFTAFTNEHQPDIYYIILDSYAREDMLRELYEYDNSEFLTALEERGFYIAAESHANYLKTTLSIASTLNMAHLNHLPALLQKNEVDNSQYAVNLVAKNITDENHVSRVLKNFNYTIVSFSNGQATSHFKNVDIYERNESPDNFTFWQTFLKFMILDTSLANLLSRFGQNETILHDNMSQHRAAILFTFDHLSKYATQDGNFFVYAHILSPHTPFVFDQHGNPIANQDPFTLLDLRPGNPENIELYRNQLHYINSLVITAIDEILENSAQPPVIILQADHGSRVYSHLEKHDYSDYKLNVPIFNAYYFPNAPDIPVYPTITPVNTFRIILNAYFGYNLPLEEDQSYHWSITDNKAEFVDICYAYNYCEEN